MAPSSSSTKKAARLAQKGKGQKVRFQGGTLFPVIVALVIVLGFGLIVYARQSRPAADASAPTINDHWHHTYGFYICGEWVQFEGDGEARDINNQPTNVEYARSGIHSHDDGLIHWHPFSSASVGRRADLGVFLDVYGVELSNDVLQFPEDQLQPAITAVSEDGRFESGETECPGIDGGDPETGRLQVVRWDSVDSPGDGTTFIAGFDGIGLNQDAMVIAIAFVPDDTTIEKPPWNAQFEDNVANDTNQQGADELFPGVEVSPDGDVTSDSVPLDQNDVGPAVDEDTGTDPDTTDGANLAGDTPTDDSEPIDEADTDTSEPVTTDADDG
ncbi:MAG: hypothetical protein WA964_04520 [Ilumatobacter sp.]|uniref:hypothetical protein n=1 Tax=Ilumatobacter sp. TaxID=1967498 RepID=UPI003C788458